MPKAVVSTADAAPPGASYSQGISANGLIFTSGLGPQDPQTGAVIGTGIAAQTRQTMANLSAVLRAAGLSLCDVVKVTVHLADLHRDFRMFDEVYRQLMPEPLPARTTTGSTLWNILVEIDVIAVCGD